MWRKNLSFLFPILSNTVDILFRQGGRRLPYIFLTYNKPLANHFPVLPTCLTNRNHNDLPDSVLYKNRQNWITSDRPKNEKIQAYKKKVKLSLCLTN
jgi:hypothetical protein